MRFQYIKWTPRYGVSVIHAGNFLVGGNKSEVIYINETQ